MTVRNSDAESIAPVLARVDPAVPRKRGRPPVPRAPYLGPDLTLATETLHSIPLQALNLEDETLQIRMSSRPDPCLVDSVRSVGIQAPLILRPHPHKDGEYQLVCGFRRANAAREAGVAHVPAIVRTLGDEEAQIVAYTENEHRKTLRDLDRARAMDKFRRAGKTTAEIGALFRLSDRQVQRIEGILNYPLELQEALNNESSGITCTSALILWQAKRRHGEAFDLAEWIEVAAENPNIDDLKRAISRHFAPNRIPGTLLRRSTTKITIHLSELRAASADQREEALSELRLLLEEMAG